MTPLVVRAKPARTLTNSDETNATNDVSVDQPETQAQAQEEQDAQRPSNPHDGLFYLTFSKPHLAAGELKHLFGPVAPDFVQMADWDSLTLLSNKFVDTKLRAKYSDALFSLRVMGAEVLVYVLFEHKSESERWTLLQLAEYLTRIWRTYLAEEANQGRKFLPIVLPVVVHHSARGWTSPMRFRDYFDVPEPLMRVLAPYMLDFGIVLDDISKDSSEALRARLMPVEAKFVLFCLRFGRTPDAFFENLPNWATEFEAVRHGPDGTLVISAMIVYLMTAGKMSWQEIRMRFEENEGLDDAAEEIIFLGQGRFDELQQLYVRRGVRQGVRQGVQQGVRDTLRNTLRKLLTQRFGELPQHINARIMSASTEELDAMTMRVITAPTLQDVFGGPTNDAETPPTVKTVGYST